MLNIFIVKKRQRRNCQFVISTKLNYVTVRVKVNKVSLRMKLSEFINTDYEPIIMEYIDECHSRKPFFLNFWCNEGEIDVDTINRFMMNISLSYISEQS